MNLLFPFVSLISLFVPYFLSFFPSQEFIVPLGGNLYQTKGELVEKIGENGMESWNSQDTEWSIFIRSSEETKAKLALEIPANNSSNTFVVRLNGQFELVKVGETKGWIELNPFPLKDGYNEIHLKGIKKDGNGFSLIKSLKIIPEKEVELTYVKDNESNRYYWGRRGPSVHLTYTLPEGKDFKWFYNEITVNPGDDPIGSYFMANGFAEGYFGIQVNSETERRILFSVWSPFKTDDPKAIPEDQKIKLLKKGEGVYTGEFGNEGSGGQSFLKYPWKAGVTYSFLNSVEPDGKGNTTYTAYFLDPEKNQWMLIASFLRPQTDTWYKRPHSFLENFIPTKGHLSRQGNYKNQWAADANRNWVELTEAKFTGDDIARRGFRLDFAGGTSNQIFYLKNGGFFDETVPLNSMHHRPVVGQAPKIDWSLLP